jgi:hypothetical protein
MVLLRNCDFLVRRGPEIQRKILNRGNGSGSSAR